MVELHKRNVPRWRIRSGQTLLEVLVALLLLSVGIAWALQVMAMGLRISQQTQATLLAVKGVQEYQLEYFRGLDFSALAPVSNQLITTNPLLNDPTAPLRGGQGHYWVETVNAQLKNVTVQVTWTDPDGRTRNSVVSTLIGCRGLTDPATGPACP